jgi:hypothetical protein
VHDVGRDAGPPEPRVKGLDALEVERIVGGVRVELSGPPALVVPDDRRVGDHAAAADLGELGEVGAQLHHLAPDLRVGAGVRHHSRVELLGAGP